MIKSLAYEDDVSKWDSDANIESLDLTCTDFEAPLVKDFPKLKRFRAVSCNKLNQITFENCPELEAVDLHYCERLVSLSFVNCPKISAIDVSICASMRAITGNCLHNVRYLSAYRTRIERIDGMESLQYLDLRLRSRMKFNLSNYPVLEQLALNERNIDMESLLEHECLEVVSITQGKVFSSTASIPSKSLKYLRLGEGGQIVGPYPESITIFGDELIQGEIKRETKTSKWKSAALLLYGPWGIPPVDLLPRYKNIDPVCSPPKGINVNMAVSAISGAIYGSAVMDMIGAGVEFWKKDPALVALRQPFDMTWSHPSITRHSCAFLKGTPTDDTSQAVLIMRSLIETQQRIVMANGKNVFKVGPIFVDGKDFAVKLMDWAQYGHQEHKQSGGLGMGNTVYEVISSPFYASSPFDCAKHVWENSGRRAAANGSIMRNAPCGAMMFWDENVVVKLAEIFCKFTHWDPRCVFSCICAALLESRLIQKAARIISDVDIDKTIEDAECLTEDISKYQREINHYVYAKTIEELDLGSAEKIGYTLKALGAAIWALRYATSFTDGMERIISQGGDSDTNGAVAGALLGAKFGFRGIPKCTIELMHTNEWIMKELEAFLKIMDLPAPERIW